ILAFRSHSPAPPRGAAGAWQPTSRRRGAAILALLAGSLQAILAFRSHSPAPPRGAAGAWQPTSRRRGAAILAARRDLRGIPIAVTSDNPPTVGGEPPDPEAGLAHMSLMEHLRELRRRI